MTADSVKNVDKPKPSLLKQAALQIVAGGSAGFVEVCIMHPLDLVKTRLQIQSKKSIGASTSSAGNQVCSEIEAFYSYITYIISKWLWKRAKSREYIKLKWCFFFSVVCDHLKADLLQGCFWLLPKNVSTWRTILVLERHFTANFSWNTQTCHKIRMFWAIQAIFYVWFR